LYYSSCEGKKRIKLRMIVTDTDFSS